VGCKRIARLMRAAGLAGVSRRRGIRTTRRDPDGRRAPDLVERNFTVPAVDRLWVADITYVPTLAGFLFLPSCWTLQSADRSAGRWPAICGPNSCSTP